MKSRRKLKGHKRPLDAEKYSTREDSKTVRRKKNALKARGHGMEESL